ncbi:GGDEF domain-containing protein [Devosia sp. BK]|uniref:GGDEF domain-containing protein n=1 Tax=Devosia sp. BK TaxID=2871706 RepID=UPI0029399226|nr:GGDEF domain-containing protein [Devosia sp. BK]MDV3251357.1 GGDEF domain-containing protein [Devosia sp. BK]
MDSSTAVGSTKRLSPKQIILGLMVAGSTLLWCVAGLQLQAVAPDIGIWPANAILLGILAANRRANTPVTWILSALAYVLAAMLMGRPLGQAVLFMIENASGIFVGLLLIHRYSARLTPITDPAGLVTMFGILLAVSLTHGLVGDLIAPSGFDIALLEGFFLRSVTEFLNLTIFLPLVAAQRMIRGPLKQKAGPGRRRFVLHSVSLVCLVAAFAGMAVIGGPGAPAFYLPGLIWCVTRVRSLVGFILAAIGAVWTLVSVQTGIVSLYAEHLHVETQLDLASFRLGVASITLSALAVVALNAFWRRSAQEDKQRADHDALTGLLTRKQFYESADYSLGQLKPETNSIAIAIEIDRFRSISHGRGQDTGDQVVLTVSELLTANIRRGDILGRLGGEEFAILLPGAGLEEGNRVAERMRASIAAEPFRHDGSDFSTSVSIGLVEFKTPANFSRMLSLADEALYEAKSAGRNRVVAYRNDGSDENAA